MEDFRGRVFSSSEVLELPPLVLFRELLAWGLFRSEHLDRFMIENAVGDLVYSRLSAGWSLDLRFASLKFAYTILSQSAPGLRRSIRSYLIDHIIQSGKELEARNKCGNFG